MNQQIEYDKLLKDFRDLQLRVTRFSAIEQELINTRDKLDQELELYKRMQHYNSEMLKRKNDDDFFGFVTEGFVDVLEVESAIIIFKSFEFDKPKLYSEGIRVEFNEIEYFKELQLFLSSFEPNECVTASKEVLFNFHTLAELGSALVTSFSDATLGYQVYVLAGISISNTKLYKPIGESQKTLFKLFSQQAESVLASRKRSEKIENQIERISESEKELKKLSLIATRTKNGVIITDTFGQIEWVNDAFTQITGYHLDEVMGRKPKDFLQGHDTDTPELQDLKKALWSKKDTEVTLVNYDKQGNPYFNQLEVISVFDDKGKHVNFIALQRDITNEIEAQSQILKMNSRFELISRQSRIGIWEWDSKTNQVEWNDVLYEICGISKRIRKENLLDTWKTCLHEEDAQAVVNYLTSLMNGEVESASYTYRLIRQTDSAVRFIQASIIAERGMNGEVLRLVGSSMDISELRELQESLENAVAERDASITRMNILKDFYESILAHSPSQIQVFDPNLRLSFSNIAHIRCNSHWNLPLYKDFHEHAQVAPESRMTLLNSINEAVSDQKLIQVEDHYLNAKDEEVFVLRSILPHYSESGELENVIVIGIDITELKNAQDALIENNQELKKINLELDNFVYSISHDLRSPLLSIKGIISLIRHQGNIDEQSKKFLDLADTSVVRLDNTIQEILEYSRNSRLDIVNDEFNMDDLIQNVFDDLKFSVSEEISLNLHHQGNALVYADRARINILLKNILGNSVKYRRANVESEIHVDVQVDSNQLFLEITDNGQGIAEEHLHKVFKMFYRATTASVGTGLGLYICQEIITKLGGTIQIDSKLGVGTRIKIQIPLTSKL